MSDLAMPAKAPLAMGLYFWPRGGSSQVARSLCRALDGSRWSPTLFAGSLGPNTEQSNAHRFFAGIPCEPMDYTQAVCDWEHGADPMRSSVPMHASFEDKPGVPDRIFFDLDDAAFYRQVRSWSHLLLSRTVEPPSVVHLHHLTPMHEAVRLVWPGARIVTHLHGTELKMLISARSDNTAGRPRRCATRWVERMQRWAADSDGLVVVSPHDAQMAEQLLPISPEVVSRIPNGVDTHIFAPRYRTVSERLAVWRRLLVTDPRGWRAGCPAGSVRYKDADLTAFADIDGEPVPVVVFAGRFLGFKRLSLLIEAHHAMQTTTLSRSVLVVVGGFPGEWEGEHPYDTVRRLNVKDVFFVGWRGHQDLAEILASSDVFAAPSVDEPFGLVYLEAMAAGLPPIATNSGGPPSFINVDPDRPTGWLVPPDDRTALACALFEAVSDRGARVSRGRRAASFVRDQYSWASTAKMFSDLYTELVAGQIA